MDDSCSLENCSEHDVLLFGSILKVDTLKKEVNEHFRKTKLGQQITESLNAKNIYVSGIVIKGSGRYVSTFYDKWFIDGVDCEILKLGAASWQKGKVRIKLNVSLEFCPDEPEVEKNSAVTLQEISQSESPLDELRRMIDHV